MHAASAPTLLARLRGSARLALLVLVLMVLKIGAASACVSHDFAELGLGTASSQDAVAKAAPPITDESVPATAASHAATCQHCSCHHAAAVLTDADATFGAPRECPPGLTLQTPPNAALRSELKPPIV
ncbi:hypothetical protein [Noviluteimonas dokdonensis]|uniref:hypothetical protein n=1 Tax=Noviluteimonas dokdonensis TaxID=414050 RepID=UPI00055F6E1A|nr:hypothetical protein [Lysobacter dokdonensis]